MFKVKYRIQDTAFGVTFHCLWYTSCYNPSRMDIQWHGLSCFTLKGKNGTLVTDPYDSKLAGITLPKLSPDIVVANADFPLHNAVSGFGPEVNIFNWPGEYEAKNIIVQGATAYDRPREKEEGKKDDANKVIVFSLEIDGFKICHLSNIGHRIATDMLEMIGGVDILLIPVGGTVCLDAKKAHEVIEQIDPRIVIPMYYKIPGVKLPLGELDLFLKEMGIHAPAKEDVLKFQAPSTLPQEKTEFKILEPVLG